MWLLFAKLAKGDGAADDASKKVSSRSAASRSSSRARIAEIVRGVNAMLDAILLPIGEGNRILAQIHRQD